MLSLAQRTSAEICARSAHKAIVQLAEWSVWSMFGIGVPPRAPK